MHCIDDEIPFEIPESWEWVSIKTITSKITDGTHHSPKSYSNGQYKYVTAKNIKATGLDLNEITYVDDNTHNDIYSRCNPEYGDILYIKDGATTGITAINNLTEPFSLLSSVALIKPFLQICNKYLLFFLQSSYCYNSVRNSMKGVGITRITLKLIEHWKISLPPLSEQHRIVESIEQTFALINRIEADKSALSKAIKQTKAKVLDLAIRGKLVPQDPNDEPASVLLERIKAEKQASAKGTKKQQQQPATTSDNSHYENMPFEIPDSWTWTTLGDVGTWQSGSTPSRLRKDYYDGCIPWLKTGDLNDGVIDTIPESISDLALQETSAKLNPSGSVLMAMYGATIGKLGILSIQATTNQACCACSDFKGIINTYLFYFLLANRLNFIQMGGGGAQPNISKEKIVSTILPIPPYTEQRRIVGKIENMYNLLNIIEESLL